MMIMFLVVVVVVPEVDSLALRLLIMPLNLRFEMRVLTSLAVFVARDGVLVVAALVAELPRLLLGDGTVLIIFTMSMTMVVPSSHIQVAGCGGGRLNCWRDI